MSRLNASVSEAHYSIKGFKGVNESPDGDTSLKAGEAAVMRNWRITDGGGLKKRPGSKRMIGLAGSYNVHLDVETAVIEELNVSEQTLTMYPECIAGDDGTLTLRGTAAAVTFDNAADHIGYYFQQGEDIYCLTRAAKVPNQTLSGTVREVDGGWVTMNEMPDEVSLSGYEMDCYDSFSLRNGMFYLKDLRKVNTAHGRTYSPPVYRASLGPRPGDSGSRVYAIDRTAAARLDDDDKWWRTDVQGTMYSYAADAVYTWYGRKASVGAVGDDLGVRALWTGYVKEEKMFMAACGGALWRLREGEKGFERTRIGSIDTSGAVTLFGMGGKLYCLDGTEYYVWDGSTFGTVQGYVPCVVSAAAPGGGGLTREQVNKLTRRRRELFSSNGSDTVYQLAETQLESVEKVTVDGAAVGGTVVDLKKGTVTFSKAPKTGQNNVEISYTASLTHSYTFTGNGSGKTFTLPPTEKEIEEVLTVKVDDKEVSGWTVKGNVVTLSTAPETDKTVKITVRLVDPRAEVVKMRYAEFYNGTQDNRIFLYGNGSNEAFYSGIDLNAKGNAEYFPDLNEVAFGDNSPLTAMCRHYNRLLVFKADGAYSVAYDIITLADGQQTAGFYVSAVNKDIGCEAMGQAVLVENRVRTPDGRSIYEWRASNTSGNVTNDQRNAQRVSQRVEVTLKGLDISTLTCFFDKIRHEYYAVGNSTALVHNTEQDAWSVYTAFPATAFALWGDELYAGDSSGWLRHISEDYDTDDGEAIECYWESGSLSFDRDWVRKYSATLWVSLKPGEGESVSVGMRDDHCDEDEKEALSAEGDIATTKRVRMKGRKFAFWKLLLESRAEKTATVEAVTVSVTYTTDVKRR